jgi:hypothetical protein
MAVWKNRLELADVWHDDEKSHQEKAKIAVERIKAAAWFKAAERRAGHTLDDEDDTRLLEVVEEMSDAADLVPFDGGWFDGVWAAFYDWCDDARVWVATA